MSSAIPSMTCLTIINSRIGCLYTGISDLKACLNYFCIVNKLQDLAHAKLVNKLGGHEVWLNIHACQPNKVICHIFLG